MGICPSWENLVLGIARGMKINIMKICVFSSKDGGVTGLSTVGKNVDLLLFLPTTDKR